MKLESIREHKLRTILQFSIPAIIAMVLASFITITDGFFIGNDIGKEGIAAVNLGLPIIYLYLAVGLMVSVGGMAIAGMAFGSGDIKKCNQVFNQTMCTITVAVIVLSMGMWLLFEPMMQLLKPDPHVALYFKAYYGIMLLQLPIMVINASFGMFIRGEGNPQYFMQINILNVVLNILLDYVFIRWFGWGIEGIALASLIATLIALLCSISFFLKKSQVYKLQRFTFQKDVFKHTILNGSSEFIGEMSLSISMFAYNFVILKNVGVDGVTAFSIVGYVAYVFSMIIIGFGQGVSPIISFSYGAKEYGLASCIHKMTSKLVCGVGAVVLLVLVVTSGWYSQLFVKSEAVQQMVQSGVMLFAISFLFSGINTIASFYFTSIGKAMESAIISSARGLVVLLICIFTLPVWWGMTGVWLVAPVTEGITLILSLFFILREAREISVAAHM